MHLKFKTNVQFFMKIVRFNAVNILKSSIKYYENQI